jgi:hypothetical protein
MSAWGSPVEIERRNRIRVAVWAFAYELMNDTLVPDEVFDRVALQIDPKMPTGNLTLDKFFAAHFDPSTGMWVRRHPDLKGLAKAYARIKKETAECPQPEPCATSASPIETS